MMVNTTPRGLNISLDRSGYTIFVLGFCSVGKMVFERMARPNFLRGATVSLLKFTF